MFIEYLLGGVVSVALLVYLTRALFPRPSGSSAHSERRRSHDLDS